MRKQGFCKCETNAQISFTETMFSLQGTYNPYIRNFKPIAIFYGCIVWYVSDLVKPRKPVLAQRGSYKNGYFEDLKNKGVDQMCCYCAAEQCLWDGSINSMIHLLDKS